MQHEIDPTKIRIYEPSFYWDNDRTILKGMTSIPIRALIHTPLFGKAKDIGDAMIMRSFAKNSHFEFPCAVDVQVDDKGFVCDLRVPPAAEVKAEVMVI